MLSCRREPNKRSDSGLLEEMAGGNFRIRAGGIGDDSAASPQWAYSMLSPLSFVTLPEAVRASTHIPEGATHCAFGHPLAPRDLRVAFGPGPRRESGDGNGDNADDRSSPSLAESGRSRSLSVHEHQLSKLTPESLEHQLYKLARTGAFFYFRPAASAQALQESLSESLSSASHGVCLQLTLVHERAQSRPAVSPRSLAPQSRPAVSPRSLAPQSRPAVSPRGVRILPDRMSPLRAD